MIPTSIQRITFRVPQQAELLTIDQDGAPLEPREVAGRTLVSLISAGTELAIYRAPAESFTPGYAAVFEVSAIGNEVTDLKRGDLVFCMGTHQSFQRHQRENVLPLPQGLSPELATFARLMSVSMSTLSTTTARPPAKVVVMGLGPVGHLAARIFTLCGYEVIACDPVEGRRTLAQQAGLPSVLSHIPIDEPSIAGQVALVLECSGHEQAVLDGCKIVQKRGEVVLVGVPWQRKTEIFAQELLHTVFHRYVVLRSGWEWELPLHTTDFRQNSIWNNLAGALQWLADERISMHNLYSTASPRHAQDVYQRLLHTQVEELAVVFDWTQ